MIKEIVKDVLFLSKPSVKANKNDTYIGADLRDTLRAHQGTCVGMAANMIGYDKQVIIVQMGMMALVMYNPSIIDKKDPYECMEGCLSLIGERRATRYKEIKIEYYDDNWKKQQISLNGWFAQIAQHELDHLRGILI